MISISLDSEVCGGDCIDKSMVHYFKGRKGLCCLVQLIKNCTEGNK